MMDYLFSLLVGWVWFCRLRCTEYDRQSVVATHDSMCSLLAGYAAASTYI